MTELSNAEVGELLREAAGLPPRKLCVCGCGRPAKSGKRYYSTRDCRGRDQSPEMRAARRRASLKRNYDLTPEQWEVMFDGQDRRCGGCGSDDPGSQNGWSVDHCHATGRVRGILCHRCNVALGFANDDPARLTALVAYLESQ